MKKLLSVTVAALLLLASCATGTKVTRLDSASQTDLSGYWNDTDVRKACEALISDFLRSPDVAQAIAAMGGRKPVVLIGSFRNQSSEHINTDIISSNMESAIFKSGKMDFVAGGSAREELRAERQDQQSGYTSDYSAAALGYETGADFLLTGTIRTIVDKAGNKTIRTYFVKAEMTNITTNMRMWIGDYNEIKKEIVRPKNKL